MKQFFFLLTWLLITVPTIFATPNQEVDSSGEPGFQLSMDMAHEFGQVVKGHDNEFERDGGFWVQNTGGFIRLQKKPFESVTIKAALGGYFWHIAALQNPTEASHKTHFKPKFDELYARFSLGDIIPYFSTLQLGIFQYKYNSQVKNLGEYLFRTGTYPPYIITGGDMVLDNADADLLALKIGGQLDQFSYSLILNQNRFLYPINDFNLTGIAQFKIMDFLTLGGGIQFASLLPVKPSRTTPKIKSNVYSLDSMQIARIDSINMYNRLNSLEPISYRDSFPDAKHYTVKGLKLMGRLCLDFSSFLPEDLFGPESFSIYLETAILGMKNYPVYYTDRNKRIPIMAGINIPTLKILDVLAFEMEFYHWNYSNEFRYIYDGIPQPFKPESDFDPKDDNFKWSLFAKKNFQNTFSVVGQIASDHLRLMERGFRIMDREIMRKPDHWYLMLQLQARM